MWRAWSGSDLAAIIFGLVLVFLTVVLWLTSSAPLVVVEARATYAKYVVQREELSLLALRDTIIYRAKGLCAGILDENGRFTGLVRSPVSTTVEYFWHRNFVQINLTRGPSDISAEPISIDRKGKPACRLETQNVVLLVPHSEMNNLRPFPILGTGEIGFELGVPNRPSAGELELELLGSDIVVRRAPVGMLIEGSAHVMGRTSLWWDSGKLFPVANSNFTIPRGSRLVSSNESSPLVGNLVLADPPNAFNIQVTTEARDLKLFRFGQSQQVETFAVGAIARAIGDPSLAPILFLLAMAGLLLPVYFGFEEMFRERRGGGK